MNKLNMMLLVSSLVCGALHAGDATTEGERKEAGMSTQVAGLLVLQQASPIREIPVVVKESPKGHRHASSWPGYPRCWGKETHSFNAHAVLKPAHPYYNDFPGQGYQPH